MLIIYYDRTAPDSFLLKNCDIVSYENIIFIFQYVIKFHEGRSLTVTGPLSRRMTNDGTIGICVAGRQSVPRTCCEQAPPGRMKQTTFPPRGKLPPLAIHQPLDSAQKYTVRQYAISRAIRTGLSKNGSSTCAIFNARSGQYPL